MPDEPLPYASPSLHARPHWRHIYAFLLAVANPILAVALFFFWFISNLLTSANAKASWVTLSVITLIALLLASTTFTLHALLRAPRPGRGLSAIALTINLFQLTALASLLFLAFLRT